MLNQTLVDLGRELIPRLDAMGDLEPDVTANEEGTEDEEEAEQEEDDDDFELPPLPPKAPKKK
ncbi:MAG TPA: hypothetical protein VKE88_01990 [Candidatus Nanoarchaeia archaeon]|nr:hypothetical protein [Candidatus Nanoarchaeia archaeon]